MTERVATADGSWAFRLGIVVLAVVAVPFLSAVAIGLTGGALLAPLSAVLFFSPLIGLQYLLWGRLLKRLTPAADEEKTEISESARESA